MANGDFGSNSDITNGIYYVEDALDFVALKSQENKGSTDAKAKIYIVNDIDFSSIENFTGSEAANIWTVDLDGQDHKISNIQYTGTDSFGLFYQFQNDSTVKNLTIEKVQVVTSSYVGVLCSAAAYHSGNKAVIIDNVHIKEIDLYSTCGATAWGDYVGGFIGKFQVSGNNSNLYPIVNFINCSVSGRITGYKCGGFIGELSGGKKYFRNCSSNCEFVGLGNLKSNASAWTSTYASGFAFSADTAGNTYQSFVNCESKCTFYNYNRAYGITGDKISVSTGVQPFLVNCKSDCKFDNCIGAYGLGFINSSKGNCSCCNISTSTYTNCTNIYGGLSTASPVISTFFDSDIVEGALDAETQGTSSSNLKDKSWLQAQRFVFVGDGNG